MVVAIRESNASFGSGQPSRNSSDIVHFLLDDILPHGRGLIAMLKAYLDRGAKKEAGGIMCVAAALFKPTPYKRLCRQWKPILEGWGASVFHATDFYTGGGEFLRKRPDGTIDPDRLRRYERDSKIIPIIVADHVHEMFVVSFMKNEYETVAPAAWRQRFGGVHRVAVQLMGAIIGHWANEKGFRGPIAYFYETGDEEEASVKDAFDKLYADPAQRKFCHMGPTAIGVESGKARGLEVADFLAWHWNKFFADTLVAPEPRTTRKDVSALLDRMYIQNKKVNVGIFSGDELHKFLISTGCYRIEG